MSRCLGHLSGVTSPWRLHDPQLRKSPKYPASVWRRTAPSLPTRGHMGTTLTSVSQTDHSVYRENRIIGEAEQGYPIGLCRSGATVNGFCSVPFRFGPRPNWEGLLLPGTVPWASQLRLCTKGAFFQNLATVCKGLNVKPGQYHGHNGLRVLQSLRCQSCRTRLNRLMRKGTVSFFQMTSGYKQYTFRFPRGQALPGTLN